MAGNYWKLVNEVLPLGSINAQLMKKNYLLIASLFLTTLAQAQTRVSMIETFTSSTCPPCVQGNLNLESVLANGQNDGKQVSLKYQMYWPGNGDPYYTDEGGDRRNVYGITGVPATLLDGQTEMNPASLTQSDLNTVYAVAPKANITAVYEVNQATQTVEISVDVEVLEDTPPGVRLYMAIFEYQTENNVESNGETEFYHVMKKMFENSGGKVMPPMTAGDVYHYESSYTFNGNYRLPADATDPIDHAIEHSVEEFSDLGVAVWVQTLLDKEVYQAVYAESGSVGLDENVEPIASAKIYPNPAAENATVAFHTTMTQDVTIEVINTMGQIVSSETLENVESGRSTHDLNLAELNAGLYSVRIASETGAITKRLVIE